MSDAAYRQIDQSGRASPMDTARYGRALSTTDRIEQGLQGLQDPALVHTSSAVSLCRIANALEHLISIAAQTEDQHVCTDACHGDRLGHSHLGYGRFDE